MRFETDGRVYDTDRLKLIGEGGEAEIFDLGRGQAAKIFKAPSHPSYCGDKAAMAAARERLAAHQQKLPAFPRGLTARVVAPAALATAGRGQIVGYSMPLVGNAEALFHYGQPAFRRSSGLTPDVAVTTMMDLHASVSALHRAGVVIGDFNDLNVLVKDSQAWLIDADSFQYGTWKTRMFSIPFVDPLLCGPDEVVLRHPYRETSDWYAYAVMLWRSLLWVHPFGGVHKPKAGKPVPHDKRALARLTVMSPDVIYPKAAIPFDRLPLDLLDRFARIFEKDERGTFPLEFVNAITWTTCPKCGTEHARTRCPSCSAAAPAAVAATIVVRGAVTVERLIRSGGAILDVDLTGPAPLVLRRTRGGAERLRAEAGAIPEQSVQVRISPGMRAFVRRDRTILVQGGSLVEIPVTGAPRRRMVDTFLGDTPAVACNANRLFWIEGGEIRREGALGPDYPERIASVVEGRTMIWAGEKLGLAVYLTPSGAGGVLFRTDGTSHREVRLPRLGDQVVALEAKLSDTHAWLFATVTRRGVRRNICLAIDAGGALRGSAEAAPEDGSWLGTIGGQCAAGAFLIAASDAGLVRLESSGTQILITKEFPDTAPFVDEATRIVAGRDGLYAVSRGELVKLTIRTA